MKSLLDDQFHKTLLSLPLFGILAFTVLPIIYMTIIAFTSYDAAHDGYANLFSWVGLENFNELFNFGKGGLGLAFGEILGWTLMWAFFATFTNYFLGMFVAIMINKKGIKIKKFWRTALVMTIAIPQFVSLLYVAKLFDATGILMNIPQDLYESSRIDGAKPWQQYTKITLPYMMFVMGPYLLTSFVGNLNNFNVIYLLTQNNQLINTEIGTAGGVSVTYTDLLITWLYKMTLNSGIRSNNLRNF